MHILYLILKVRKGMYIVCCVLGLLFGRYLQVMLCNGIMFGCQCCRIDWKAPQLGLRISVSRQYQFIIKINPAFAFIEYYFASSIAKFSC